ncbi:MAG: TIGR04211 family SH3 domain-containing protein [Gammaproteobacteria bacterium]|jgi:SH3 domain protein
MRVFAAILLLTLVSSVTFAETRFVEVEVTLRTGQGTGYSIVQMIRSGTPVEVLQEDPGSGYTRVRMPAGAEGWILTRYLTTNPVGAEQLVTAQQRIDQLQRQNGQLVTERDRYLKEADSLAEELTRLKDLSSNALALEESNQRMQATVSRQEETIGRLQSENERLASRTQRDWFIAGASVLIIGIVLGVVLPRIRWRRRRSWSDL